MARHKNTQRLRLSKRQVKVLVSNKIGEKTLETVTRAVKEECKTSRRHFWGETQPESIVDDAILLTLFKDIRGIGYDELETEIAFEYKTGRHSLQHNMHYVCEGMRRWAVKQLKVDPLPVLKELGRKAGLPEMMKEANVWMDSSDFPLKGRSSVRKSSDKFSYKLNRPGHRFMFAANGSAKMIKVWGGYSPKVYDGDFLSMNRDDLRKLFKGATIIADNHFGRGKKLFKDINFLINVAKRGSGTDESNLASKVREVEREEGAKETLTKDNESFNEQHSHARARIEKPFGYMKQIFGSLAKPWNEKPEQLDCLVAFAAVLYNINSVASN